MQTVNANNQYSIAISILRKHCILLSSMAVFKYITSLLVKYLNAVVDHNTLFTCNSLANIVSVMFKQITI